MSKSKVDINHLKKSIAKKLTKLGLHVPTLAELSVMLPKFIKDEKGNVYSFGMAQSTSISKDNRNSYLPYYKLWKGKHRKFGKTNNQGYLNWPLNWTSDTEYNAKAAMLIFIIERGWYTVERANMCLLHGYDEESPKYEDITL